MNSQVKGEISYLLTLSGIAIARVAARGPTRGASRFPTTDNLRPDSLLDTPR